MNTRGEPLCKTLPTGPEAACFGRCSRFNDFITMSEGNSNTDLIETSDGNVLIHSGMGLEAPVHHRNFREPPARSTARFGSWSSRRAKSTS